MGKLIELLNDFIPEWWSIEHWGKSIFYEWVYYNDRIIWKDFWFIKWLIYNDKIDYKKIHWEEWYIPLVDMVKFDGSKRLEVLLMLLAIQDEPIDFLIEILK